MTLAGHEASLVVFLAVLMLFAVSNLFGMPRLGSRRRRPASGRCSVPRVSVLVPARKKNGTLRRASRP